MANQLMNPRLGPANIIYKHSSVNVQAPPISVVFLCPCDKVYHKQEVRFLLHLLGQIVT